MRLVKFGKEAEPGEDVGPAWVDVDLDQPEAEQWLAKRLDLSTATHAILAESSISSRRVKVDEGVAMRICYTGEREEGVGDESAVRLGLVVMGDQLLSVRRGAIVEIDEVWGRLAKGDVEISHGWSALAMLLVRIADRVESKLDDLGTTLDDLEEAIFESGGDLQIEKLGQTRRRLIRDRRNISALGRAIDEIAEDHSGADHEEGREELALAAQAMTRHERTVAFHLERSNLLHDQVQSQLSDRMNNATLRLGVVATVFLPLGFLTGLLGINVAGIPGSHDPWAFWLVCLLLSGLAMGAWFLIGRLYRS